MWKTCVGITSGTTTQVWRGQASVDASALPYGQLQKLLHKGTARLSLVRGLSAAFKFRIILAYRLDEQNVDT